MKSEKDRQALLAAQVRWILFNIWDPIGVNTNPRLYDEYDSYVEPVVQLRRTRKAPKLESILELLAGFESSQMGIDPVAEGTEAARHRAATAIFHLFRRWG